MGVHIGTIWRLNRLCLGGPNEAAAMRPYVKLLRPLFGATVCKTVRRMLSVRCLSVLSVCNLSVLSCL